MNDTDPAPHDFTTRLLREASTVVEWVRKTGIVPFSLHLADDLNRTALPDLGITEWEFRRLYAGRRVLTGSAPYTPCNPGGRIEDDGVLVWAIFHGETSTADTFVVPAPIGESAPTPGGGAA